MYSEKISVFYKTSSEEFKRNLIEEVKKHPNVWNTDIDDSYEEWKIIRKQMNNICTIKQFQAIWSTLRSLYFQKIFIRTIERNFEAPQWPYFHDMIFMYDRVKEDIQQKLGGISPPLFKSSPSTTGEAPKPQCPCCASPESDSKSEEANKSEVKEKFNLEDIPTAASLEKDYKALENFFYTNEKASSMSSFEDNDEQPSSIENSSEPLDSVNQLPSEDVTKDKPSDELIELSEEDSADNETSDDRTAVNQSSGQIPFPVQLIKKSQSSFILSPWPDGISHGAIGKTPTPSPQITDLPKISLKKKEKNYNVSKMSHMDRSINRLELIDAIKANPITYDVSLQKRAERKNLTDAWRRVADLLGPKISTQSVKNRWGWLKNQYLKELVYEQDSGGTKKSFWEYFLEMEFMRPHMQEEITELRDLRLQLRNTIKKQTGVDPVTEKQKLPNKEIEIPRRTSSSELNVKTYSRPLKQKDQPIVVDPRTLPILQNRPVKITAVQILPSLDLTNHQDGNEEGPPAAKKLKTSVGSVEQRAENALENELMHILPSFSAPKIQPLPATPQRLASPLSSCLNFNLTGKARIQSAPAVGLNQLSQTFTPPLLVTNDLKMQSGNPELTELLVLDPNTLSIFKNPSIKLVPVATKTADNGDIIATKIQALTGSGNNKKGVTILNANLTTNKVAIEPAGVVQTSQLSQKVDQPSAGARKPQLTEGPLLDSKTLRVFQNRSIKITPKIANKRQKKKGVIVNEKPKRPPSCSAPKTQSTPPAPILNANHTANKVAIVPAAVVQTSQLSQKVDQESEGACKPQHTEGPILDSKPLRVYQNRSIKINPLNVVPLPDITNTGASAQILNKEESHHAKKFQESADLGKSKKYKIIKKDSKRLTSAPKSIPSLPGSNLTLDLTTDEVTKDSSTIVDQSVQMHQKKPQKVFPPLDLTLDDDDEEILIPAPKPAATKFQQQSYNTNIVFPLLDLTTDEDKEEDIHADKDKNAKTIANTNNDKNNTNTICLDDEDSVGSFEDVIVYLEDQELVDTN